MSKSKVTYIDDCRVVFRDKSHLSFEDTNLTKDDSNNNVLNQDFVSCRISVGGKELSFYLSNNDTQPFCRFLLKEKGSTHLDRNSQVLSFFFMNNKFSVLDIKSDVSNLEKINNFFENRIQTVVFKTPLSYTPCNRERESIFSTEATTTNLRGFMNLALITLFFSKFKDIVKNLLTYGLKLGIGTFEIDHTHVIIVGIAILLPLIIQFSLELLFMKRALKPTLTYILTPLNVLTALALPVLINLKFNPHIAISANHASATMFLMLKIISYAHVMHHIRSVAPIAFKALQDNKDPILTLGDDKLSSENWEILKKYKSDLSGLTRISDYLYFLAAPTFCYQLYYPRNPKIRWNWLLKRMIEFIVCLALMAFIAGQFLVPVLFATPEAIETGDTFTIIHAILRTSFPTTALWILMFFAIFHYYFNIVAELLRFSDRQFYLDWWNCRDMNEYWRLWNIPIHSFLTRHVYFPLLRRGFSKQIALLVVFVLSALGHEYVASVPILYFTGYITIFFALQAPLMIAQKKLDKFMKGSQIGNVIFWISFCFLGQPGGLVLLYYIYITKTVAH